MLVFPIKSKWNIEIRLLFVDTLITLTNLFSLLNKYLKVLPNSNNSASHNWWIPWWSWQHVDSGPCFYVAPSWNVMALLKFGSAFCVLWIYPHQKSVNRIFLNILNKQFAKKAKFYTNIVCYIPALEHKNKLLMLAWVWMTIVLSL